MNFPDVSHSRVNGKRKCEKQTLAQLHERRKQVVGLHLKALSRVQQDSIERTIIDKRPEQLNMAFCLWSRVAVGQLIEREYGIKLHLRSVGIYLERWGLAPHKPIKRSDEQTAMAVQASLEGKYPGLEQRARQEGAEIHWIDETALINTDARAKSLSLVGKTPTAKTDTN